MVAGYDAKKGQGLFASGEDGRTGSSEEWLRRRDNPEFESCLAKPLVLERGQGSVTSDEYHRL